MAVVDRIRDTRTFVEESWAELQKVTWPDPEQLKNATLVVIAFVIAISAIIFVMDRVVSFVLNLVMGLFGA